MKKTFAHSSPLLALLLSLPVAALAPPPSASAQPTATLTTIYNFTSPADGYNPVASLVQGTDGNFYGSTAAGGIAGGGFGTLFKVTPAGKKTTLHVLASDGSEGADIVGPLVQGPDGDFYGTASTGGSHGGYGTAFKMSPGGRFVLLTTFIQQTSTGINPTGGLTLGSDGNFYGTCADEGEAHDQTVDGTAFRLTPAGAFSIVHVFNQKGTEGDMPRAGLTQAADGSFYGTCATNGPGRRGTVFRLAKDGTDKILYGFDNGANGADPSYGRLVLASDGNFYGTTTYSLYRITPAGALTTIYKFDGSGSINGSAADSGVIQGSDGNFYGMTSNGGTNGKGVIFQITPAGVGTVLYTFTGGTDGDSPEGSLVQGSDGAFYGTTVSGGADGEGTIFRLVVHPPFFAGETALANGVYYLAFSTGNYFGYYSFLSDPNYIYHFDLGYEYVFDAKDARNGVYLYDFKSKGFFYTSPTFPFPYLYDFALKSTVYYYPDPKNAGHYNTNGVRYFYDFSTGKIISK